MCPTNTNPSHTCCNFFKRDLQEAKDKVVEFIKNKTTDSLQEEPMYLYLIDEYTGDPVVPKEGGVYPIKITQPSEKAVKLLPLMRAGLKVMSVVTQKKCRPQHPGFKQRGWLECLNQTD